MSLPLPKLSFHASTTLPDASPDLLNFVSRRGSAHSAMSDNSLGSSPNGSRVGDSGFIASDGKFAHQSRRGSGGSVLSAVSGISGLSLGELIEGHEHEHEDEHEQVADLNDDSDSNKRNGGGRTGMAKSLSSSLSAPVLLDHQHEFASEGVRDTIASTNGNISLLPLPLSSLIPRPIPEEAEAPSGRMQTRTPLTSQNKLVASLFPQIAAWEATDESDQLMKKVVDMGEDESTRIEKKVDTLTGQYGVEFRRDMKKEHNSTLQDSEDSDSVTSSDTEDLVEERGKSNSPTVAFDDSRYSRQFTQAHPQSKLERESAGEDVADDLEESKVEYFDSNDCGHRQSFPMIDSEADFEEEDQQPLSPPATIVAAITTSNPHRWKEGRSPNLLLHVNTRGRGLTNASQTHRSNIHEDPTTPDTPATSTVDTDASASPDKMSSKHL